MVPLRRLHCALAAALWRLLPRGRERALERFAATEFDSAWQLLRAIPGLPRPEDRALLFRHALEELEHAGMFEALRRGGDGAAPRRAAAERAPLLPARPSREELLGFLAFFHAGESAIAARFRALAAAPWMDPALRGTLEAIGRDEDGHDDGVLRILRREAGPGASLGALLRRQRARLWRAELARWTPAPDALVALLLAAVYAAAARALRGPVARRLSLDRAAQLEIFRRQAAGHASEVSAP